MVIDSTFWVAISFIIFFGVFVNKDIILLGDLNMTHTSNRFEDFLSKTNLSIWCF